MTRKPCPATSKKRESEQRKERELFSWHSPFPLGGECERVIFAFVTLVCCKHTKLIIPLAKEGTLGRRQRTRPRERQPSGHAPPQLLSQPARPPAAAAHRKRARLRCLRGQHVGGAPQAPPSITQPYPMSTG